MLSCYFFLWEFHYGFFFFFINVMFLVVFFKKGKRSKLFSWPGCNCSIPMETWKRQLEKKSTHCSGLFFTWSYQGFSHPGKASSGCSQNSSHFLKSSCDRQTMSLCVSSLFFLLQIIMDSAEGGGFENNSMRIINTVMKLSLFKVLDKCFKWLYNLVLF